MNFSVELLGGDSSDGESSDEDSESNAEDSDDNGQGEYEHKVEYICEDELFGLLRLRVRDAN